MNASKTYVGIDKDVKGGMTEMGKLVRDGWVFGIIPESETCEGWTANQMEDLWRKTSEAWNRYNFQVGSLPPEIRDTFMRIHREAMARAREEGWSPEDDLGDEQ